MAAPSGTTWGTTINSKGRIGIYANVSSSSTKTTVNIEVWFWSKYSVSDSSNNYYYNANATTATTLIGSRTIRTTSDEGSGWSTINQIKIGESTYSYARGTSAKTISYAAKLTGVDWVGGTMTVKKSITVPKLASYTVSFNANGGSGAPGSQTKWYGKDLTLSSTRPTKAGHSFQGWGTSASDTTVNWQPGGKYTANASDTLYAIWKAAAYTISYNANGGSGGPSSQGKAHGEPLIITSSEPTRTNYTFLGWSTSPTGSVEYAPGSSYTANASTTLYAVWGLGYNKPRITGFRASRCNSYGTDDDAGTNVKVSFTWSTDKDVNRISTEYKSNSTGSTWTSLADIPASGKTGTITDKVLSASLSNQSTYSVRVYVSDSGGTAYSNEVTLGTIVFPIDVKARGTGVAFGKVAEVDDVVDFGYDARFQNAPQFMVSGRARTPVQMIPGNTYGDGINIGSGGAVLIGTGGSNTSFLNYNGSIGGSEQLYLCSNDSINFQSGIRNGYGSRKEMIFNSSGVLRVPSVHTDGELRASSIYTSGELRASSLRVDRELEVPTVHVDHSNAIKSYRMAGSLELINLIHAYNERVYVGGGVNRAEATYIHSRVNNVGIVPANDAPAGSAYKSYFYADKDGEVTCGTTARRWYRLYAKTATVQTSDRREKENIIPLGVNPMMSRSMGETPGQKDIHSELFDRLQPVQYNYIDDSKRTNFGLIAQDVIASLTELGIGENDLDLVHHDKYIDEETGEEKESFGIAYENLIALLVHEVQKLKAKIK